jgi:hypothetical protein
MEWRVSSTFSGRRPSSEAIDGIRRIGEPLHARPLGSRIGAEMFSKRRVFLMPGCRVMLRVIALSVAAGVVARASHAQSGQPWSLQASLLAASQKIGANAISGVGFEGQFRYTPAAVWSLGGGVQYSTHKSGGETITISGFFLEPRYVVDVGSERVAPYIAGRLALLHEKATLSGAGDVSSGGSAFGGGGGLLIRATSNINVDLGAAFVSQAFSDATGVNGATVSFPRFTGYVAKGGLSIGFGSR